MRMKIGVLDSGIGGLTVLSSLLKKSPDHEYVYYGDTLHLPYGEKTREEVVGYANKIIKFFEDLEVDVIVIACGTLSSNREYLKSNKEIIDIISPIKGKLDKYNKISIIATPLSIKTNAFKKYLNSELNLIACPKLVPIIEENDYSDLDKVLKDYLENTNDSDALILGCTHYPIIKEQIKKYFNKDIICLDDFVVDLIRQKETGKISLKLYFSKIDNNLEKNVKRILGREDILIERKCL